MQVDGKLGSVVLVLRLKLERKQEWVPSMAKRSRQPAYTSPMGMLALEEEARGYVPSNHLIVFGMPSTLWTGWKRMSSDGQKIGAHALTTDAFGYCSTHIEWALSAPSLDLAEDPLSSKEGS